MVINNHDQQDKVTQNSSRSTGKKLKSWGRDGIKAAGVLCFPCIAGSSGGDGAIILWMITAPLSIPVIIGSGVMYGVGAGMNKYTKWQNKSKHQQGEDEQFQDQHQDNDSAPSTSMMLQGREIEQPYNPDLSR